MKLLTLNTILLIHHYFTIYFTYRHIFVTKFSHIGYVFKSYEITWRQKKINNLHLSNIEEFISHFVIHSEQFLLSISLYFKTDFLPEKKIWTIEMKFKVILQCGKI